MQFSEKSNRGFHARFSLAFHSVQSPRLQFPQRRFAWSNQMEKYILVGRIGQGRFGEVLKYLDPDTSAIYAVKCIPYVDENEGVPCSVLREISVLKELDHGNVVRLFDVKDDDRGFYLLFECLELDLNTFINNGSKTGVDPHLIKSFLFQILQGVSYCHSRKVLHGDLKPHNLLINPKSKTVKLAGFGCTRTFDAPLPSYSNEVATPAYSAPELLLGNLDSSAVDIWSVGCIFAEMVTKRPLFHGCYSPYVMVQIIRMLGLSDERNWPGVTSPCLKMPQIAKLSSEPTASLADIVPGIETNGLDLLSKMLCMDPLRRITAYDALRHPYFTDFQVNP